MSVAAEPKPASLPLPGGRKGATVRLHPLLAGEMLAPPGLLERPKGAFATLRVGRTRDDDKIWVPVPFFLVEHPSAGALLVDTGFHPSVATDPALNFGRTYTRFAKFRMEPDQAPAAQLRARGIEPGEVRTVVMTHLHNDHAGGVPEFPDATFLVDGGEWESAIDRGGLRRGYRRQQFDYAFDWRLLDYEDAAVDSFASFGRSLDLFGDGSVRLLSTPGHTVGHQSVLLRLGDREALLTGDAAYTKAAIAPGQTPLLMADEHRFFRSLREIRRYVEQTPSALVIPGHDREAWPVLEPVYG